MKNRSLALLSGEGTSIPEAEARSLFLSYDPGSEFESPEPTVLLARSSADPFVVGSRIAFARRVGRLLDGQEECSELLRGRRVRFRAFGVGGSRVDAEPATFLRGVEAEVDLENPEYEITLVRGKEDYLALTSPVTMRQRWSARRPRARAFFHPSAMFPKLSRALFNLSRCKEGETFLDPFAGTGSIPIEASVAGAHSIAIDVARLMARGALSNMKQFSQEWLGVLRADATAPPLRRVDAIATDIPYGRASSTHGLDTGRILTSLLPSLARILRPSAFMVVMHPKEVPVEDPAGLALVEEHNLHVHKLLTRTISVLRRR